MTYYLRDGNMYRFVPDRNMLAYIPEFKKHPDNGTGPSRIQRGWKEFI